MVTSVVGAGVVVAGQHLKPLSTESKDTEVFYELLDVAAVIATRPEVGFDEQPMSADPKDEDITSRDLKTEISI